MINVVYYPSRRHVFKFRSFFFFFLSITTSFPPLILCTWGRQSSVWMTGARLPPPPPSPPPLVPHHPRPHPLYLKARDLTFVWTMPALWSLKCSRVAAISISLAPATDRKLDWVQSSGVIQLTSVNLSLYWAPFGTAQRLKIITFIPRKTWTRATDCFPIKYAGGYFGGPQNVQVKRIRNVQSAGVSVRILFKKWI